LERALLYRLVIARELVGGIAPDGRAAAERLGEAMMDNRRDEISGVMLIHAGWLVQMIEGARVDVDRALRRMQADGQGDLHLLGDRPVIHRRATEPIRMCALTPHQVELALAGRALNALEPIELERLLCGEVRRQAA